METYGIDKPDLRNPLIIQEASMLFTNTEFNAFKGKIVKAIVVENGAVQGRKFFDNMTTYAIEEAGAKGLAWVKLEEEGPVGGIAKFITPEMKQQLENHLQAKVGDSIFFVADEKLEVVQK